MYFNFPLQLQPNILWVQSPSSSEKVSQWAIWVSLKSDLLRPSGQWVSLHQPNAPAWEQVCGIQVEKEFLICGGYCFLKLHHLARKGIDGGKVELNPPYSNAFYHLSSSKWGLESCDPNPFNLVQIRALRMCKCRHSLCITEVQYLKAVLSYAVDGKQPVQSLTRQYIWAAATATDLKAQLSGWWCSWTQTLAKSHSCHNICFCCKRPAFCSN